MYKFLAWVAGIFLLAATGLWIYVIAQFTISTQPVLAGVSLVTGGLALFILIILARIERMTKGMLLVSLAVITALLNSVMVEPMFVLLNTVDGKTSAAQEVITLHYGKWILENFEMNSFQFLNASKQWINAMLSFINIACAGAGGSIIAVEGDRMSIVRPVVSWRGWKEWKIWKIWKSKTKNPSGSTSPTAVIPDTSTFMHSLGGKMDRQAEAMSDLFKLIAGLDKQMTTLSKQQNRIRWAFQITAVAAAVVVGFAVGAVVFSRS
jgi:hypothetical protein